MKKNEKIKYPLPAFEVIADAIVGDVTALQRLLKHYDQKRRAQRRNRPSYPNF